MTLGEKLKNMREKAGLSQIDVANKMQWKTPQLCSNFERNISFPPLKCLSKMANLYCVNEREFKYLVYDAMVSKYSNMLKKKMKI